MMFIRSYQRVLLVLSMLLSVGTVLGAESGNYIVDTDHTHIGFSVSHLGISFVVGRFNSFSGEFKVDPQGESSVSISVDTASVDTNNERRDRHLRSGDFFNAAIHPKMQFQSSKVNFNENGEPTEIKGNLTLHGVTREVTLAVGEVGSGLGPLGKTRAGYQAKTSINRSDFAMNEFLAVAGDQVDILINLEGIKQ